MQTHTKLAKTPPIGQKTTLLSFDIETNGLHGEAFAVGAVLVDAHLQVLDKFSGRTNIVGSVDLWVETHVLPVIKTMPMTHTSYKNLREAFWDWFLKAQRSADYVLVSNGYPVEYRFLLKCQEENLEERYWQHPFPILDLTSLMIQAEGDATKRNALAKQTFETGGYSRHHPEHDALVSAILAFESFRRLSKIK